MYKTCNKKPTQYPTRVNVFSLHFVELLNYRLPQYGNSCLLTLLGGVHLQCKVSSALKFSDKWYSTKSNSTTVKDIIYRGLFIEIYVSVNKKSWFPPENSLNYRGGDKSLARTERKQANISVRMAWISFIALPLKKKLDDSSRLDFVEIARSLTCFRACFLPGRAKDLTAPRI